MINKFLLSAFASYGLLFFYTQHIFHRALSMQEWSKLVLMQTSAYDGYSLLMPNMPYLVLIILWLILLFSFVLKDYSESETFFLFLLYRQSKKEYFKERVKEEMKILSKYLALSFVVFTVYLFLFSRDKGGYLAIFPTIFVYYLKMMLLFLGVQIWLDYFRRSRDIGVKVVGMLSSSIFLFMIDSAFLSSLITYHENLSLLMVYTAGVFTFTALSFAIVLKLSEKVKEF